MYGSAYPIGKLGTNELPPLLMGSLRVLILFIFILPFFKYKVPKKKFLNLIFFSISMGFFVYGFLYLSISYSSLISPIIIGAQLSIPIGLILSLVLLNEHISLRKWALVLLSFIGVLIVSYDPRFADEIIAFIFVLLMSFFYALSNILSRFLKEIDTITQIGWHSIIGFILLASLSLLYEGNPTNHFRSLNNIAVFSIIHAAIISLIGHGGMFYLYKFYPVSKVLPFYSLFPIFGIFLTFVILTEIPGPYEILGGSIVIVSIFLIHLDNKKY
tara:strand:- start:458 stop:1273 length:816 start_codon:yes stop_codon:yes gene_type:complete